MTGREDVERMGLLADFAFRMIARRLFHKHALPF